MENSAPQSTWGAERLIRSLFEELNHLPSVYASIKKTLEQIVLLKRFEG